MTSYWSVLKLLQKSKAQPQICRSICCFLKCWAGDIYASPVSLHPVLVRCCYLVTVAGTEPRERERAGQTERNPMFKI